MTRQHASLTIEFASRQALEEYVYNLADAGMIPDGTDVYHKDALDTPGRRAKSGEFIIRSVGEGRPNGILGRVPEISEEGT